MMQSIQLYRSKPVLLLQLLGISAVVQFLRIWVHYVCGIGLGIRTHFTYYLIIVPILALSAVVPITFGGIGLREVTGAEMFKHVGMDLRLAFVMEMLATALGILASLLGGVIYVFLKPPAAAGESTHD
jgi:glycosyltransferase 2 family protein